MAQLFQGSWREDLNRHRLRAAFRGQPDAETPLLTPLERMGPHAWRVEGAMLRAFCKYAHREAVGRHGLWDWLAIARHHGLPTRLLDWTYSPFVALHFATAELPDVDGAIWRVELAETQRHLPPRVRRALKSAEADVFTAELLDGLAQSLAKLEKLSKKDFLLFFEPPSLDGRIVNQFALFSLMSRATASLDRWLAARPGTARRILIPAPLKAQIRDMLDQSNITERLLFPGLDGLSQYLRRYYQPSPDLPPGAR